jgi:hypothetical protein
MNQEYSFQKAPRCSATSKRTCERCKAPAVRGWTVCRFHGARGGAPKGKANGAYKYGGGPEGAPLAFGPPPAIAEGDRPGSYSVSTKRASPWHMEPLRRTSESTTFIVAHPRC